MKENKLLVKFHINVLIETYLQVLQKKLDEVQKSTETLSERLDKAREENDDLRFQVSGNQNCMRHEFFFI